MTAPLELRITAVLPSGAQVVRSVPIADAAEAADAERWMAGSDDRWQALGEGRLRRDIVPAGGAVTR